MPSESKLTLAEKYEVGVKHSRDRINSTELSKLYNIPESTVRWYASKVRKGNPFFAKSSRPTILEPQHELELKNILINNNSNTINVEEEVNKLYYKTCELRGIKQTDTTLQAIQKGTIAHLENKVLPKYNKRKYNLTVPRPKRSFTNKKIKITTDTTNSTTTDNNNTSSTCNQVVSENLNNHNKTTNTCSSSSETILSTIIPNPLLVKKSNKTIKDIKEIIKPNIIQPSQKILNKSNKTIKKMNTNKKIDIDTITIVKENVQKFTRSSRKKEEIIKDFNISDSEEDE